MNKIVKIYIISSICCAFTAYSMVPFEQARIAGQHSGSMQQAAGDGNTLELQQLIETCCANPIIRDNELRDALAVAARFNRIQCMQALLTAGAPLSNPHASFDDTPLFEAVKSLLMFIAGRNPAAWNLCSSCFNYIKFGECADTTQAIEMLLNTPNHSQQRCWRTPLGLAMNVKQYFSNNDPEYQRINQLINLLTTHGETLTEREEAQFCANPAVRSIEQMICFHNSIDPFDPRCSRRCERIGFWTRLCTTCSLAAAALIKRHSILANIATGDKPLLLNGLAGVASFICSWYIVPTLITGAYSKINYFRRRRLERSLFTAIDNICDSNPDAQTNRVLRYILSSNQYGGIARQCADHLQTKLQHHA